MMYKVIERKDPRNPKGQGKFYAVIVSMYQIGIEEIATRISSTCTVTRHDCLAVLSALQALKEGKRVHLGDLGCLRVVANGLGSDSAESYDPTLLTRLHVRFTPNKRLKDAVSLNNKDFSLERITFTEQANNGQDENSEG